MRTLQLDDELSGPHLHNIALKLRSSKRTVFVAGAGISCNAGIPDFRSKDGLYALVKRQFPGNFVQGKDLFDSVLFRDSKSTQIFYSFMAGLRSAVLEAEPTATHHFLRLLKNKRKLVRCYTQNIDGLEQRAGLGQSETVQLHGDIHRLKCTHCQSKTAWSPEHIVEMQNGVAPDCMECINISMARKLSGKRGVSVGQLRPDIVLYGEEHPEGDEIATVLKKDCQRNPQMLIVAGTSLKVVGIKRLVKSLAQATRAAGGTVIFVNKSPVAPSEWDNIFDYHVSSDTDAWITNIRSFIPTFFERQTKIKVERKRKLPVAPLQKDIQKDSQKDSSGDSHRVTQKDGPASQKDSQKDKLSKDANGLPKDILSPAIKNEAPECTIISAKRTKSDPYQETNQQNALLESPKSIKVSLDDPETSPLLNIIEPEEEVPPLEFK